MIIQSHIESTDIETRNSSSLRKRIHLIFTQAQNRPDPRKAVLEASRRPFLLDHEFGMKIVNLAISSETSSLRPGRERLTIGL